jgi:hypothetical protein
MARTVLLRAMLNRLFNWEWRAVTELQDTSWLHLPKDLLRYGLKRELIQTFAGVEVRSAPDGGLRILPTEQYRHTRRPAIESILIARGTKFYADGMQKLTAPPSIADVTSAAELDGMRKAREIASASLPKPEPSWAAFIGRGQLISESELPSLLEEIQELGAAGDAIWAFAGSPILSQRLGLMRALFAVRHAGEAWQMKNGGFPAARALMANSTAGFTLYLQPPLLYRAPWYWGSMAMRAHRTMARTIATPERSTSLSWGSPLDSTAGHMFQAPAMPEPLHDPTESAEDREAFLLWWGEHVSDLVYVLSNLGYYRNEADEYRPERQFATVGSVERLFVTSIELMRLRKVSELLRKQLLFQVLHILDGLGLGNHEKNLHYTKQLASWHEVKASLPLGPQRCLTPLIEGGFEALRRVEETIWAKSRLQGGRLKVTKKDGAGQDDIVIDRARGEYLHLLRDTHHGYRKLVDNERDLSYLAAFTGELSERLPDLAWWYLVRLLDNPEELVSRYRERPVAAPPNAGATA